MGTALVSRRSGERLNELTVGFKFISNHGKIYRRQNIDWGADPAQINAQAGCAVVPCANQLGVHADLGSLADRFHHIDRPIVAIGLGAQSHSMSIIPQIPEDSIRWVREIIEHAPADYPNITVRGNFTKRVLEQHGLADQVIVLGCPSLFINPDPALGKKIHSHVRPIRRIAVASGNPWEHWVRLESSLAGLVTATQGAYICQHPLAMLKLARGEAFSLSQDVLLKIRDYICPHLSLDE
ncbi:MAG: polysaccharide pyruvyl transferase family protein [Candidatus Competibacteraceae bacterium]|nr:polysaccharide pyruvyl transferase family protein [Candidatus Competibacteraceae bacterium]